MNKQNTKSYIANDIYKGSKVYSTADMQVKAFDKLIDDLEPANNSTITIKQNGVTKGTFTTNQAENSTIDVGQGDETVFTAGFLKKVLTCRMWNKVYLTSLFDVSPNMVEYNGLPEPGASSTNWCGNGSTATTLASSRIIIHNVNVEPWQGRTFTFTVAEGYEMAIASGTVTQSAGWQKPYPQTSDLAWNWHGHGDPVTITLGNMISIMFRNTSNGSINWNYFYATMWDLLSVEETANSVQNPPRKLKDDRYVGYRVGVLGDSILAGASTPSYKTALDVLVSDYGIIPVPRCIAGSCIAPTSPDYSRDGTRFKNRIEANWQFTSGGYNGAEGGVNRASDPFLGVLIFCVNDVLMDKVAIDDEPFVRDTTGGLGGEMKLNSNLDPEGYVAALVELETTIKTGAGSPLSHIYLVGPYNCTWPGAYPMSTTGINPNGDTGEDFIRVQRQLSMIKGWSYLDLLSSQINTFLPGISNDQLHPNLRGHQMLGDYLGQMLCGTILTQAAPIFEEEETSNPGSGSGSSVELVNNLTTDDSTKALAASQGVALKTMVDAKLTASSLGTINGQSILNGNNITISNNVVTVDDQAFETALYPVYRKHLFQAVATPQVALNTSITDFPIESGKKYRFDADLGTGNPYTGLSIKFQHADGTEGEQVVAGNFGQSVHVTVTADDDYDKISIYYGGATDCDFTISYEDTIANLVNGQIGEDAMTNKNNTTSIQELLDHRRRFNTSYKFACMGDSITSDQVSGIGSLVGQYLGCNVIGNFAVGSATLTNGDEFEYSVQVANNTGTPYNTLTNQVVRLLQWTTEADQQISWTYTGTQDVYTIPTTVATGLGHTDDIPDIIYIAIGTNDGLSSVGEDNIETVMSQSYANLDKKTFASALRWAVETLRCAYPKTQIFIATPLFTGSADYVEQYAKAAVMQKRNVILECCAWNSVYCIDSTMKSGYTNQIASTTVGNGAQGIHPRSYHKCMIAKFVQKEIYDNYISEIPLNEIVY